MISAIIRVLKSLNVIQALKNSTARAAFKIKIMGIIEVSTALEVIAGGTGAPENEEVKALSNECKEIANDILNQLKQRG